MTVQVQGLYRFPVKSMLGESLESAEVTAAGVLGDRGYALIDEEDGKIVSAKNPRKWAGMLGFQARYVSGPVAGEALPPVAITFPDGNELRSDDPAIDARLSAALGRPVRLASMAPDGAAFEEVWPDIEGLAPAEFIESTSIGRDEESGDAVSDIPGGMFAPPGTFFDLSVMHVLTTATLDRLQRLAPDATFDVRRYRPNVLVGVDDEGFVENEWVGRTVAIGDAVVTVTLPTMRCVMTTLAQGDLPRDRATLKAIAAHNRVEIPGFGTWACAGAYADVATAGTVRIGDPVSVV
jgi:uncharacterized protein YcbX